MQPLYITRNIHISFLPRDANQSAVLPRQVVRPSVTLKYRWLEYFYNNFVADYSSLRYSLSADSNITDILQGGHRTIPGRIDR